MSHTVDELWSEPIWHGMPWISGRAIPPEFRNNYISCGSRIRPVIDLNTPLIAREVALDKRWNERAADAWVRYCAIISEPPVIKIGGIYTVTTANKIRWWIRTKLVKIGII